ncbi:MAG: hypothetical protein GY715_08670 [Planctomycetes bacterium]|nr:hypothetical protein [Planctomycetota bacterium]
MVAALRGAIDAVELERRAAATSQQVKREAMAENALFDRGQRPDPLGFYLLARRPDLANRIRLSLPRVKPGSQNGDDSSGDEPDGDASSVDHHTRGQNRSRGGTAQHARADVERGLPGR